MTIHIIIVITFLLVLMTIVYIVVQEKAKGSLLKQIEFLRDQNLEEKKLLNNERKQLQKREIKLNELQDQTFLKMNKIENEKTRLRNEYQEKLLNIIGMDFEQAQEYYFQLMDERHATERKNIIDKHSKEIEISKRKIATKVLLNAMENISMDVVNEVFVTSVEIKNDDIKGKLIGRDGRNIKTIENELGINLIIDDTPGVINISCFDPIRREIATRSLEKLLESGKINQSSIEHVISDIKSQLNEIIIEYGSNAIDQFAISNISPDIVYALGALHFRTSFGQNVLAHSIETAKIAMKIANELKIDSQLAARCALLHDIGKYDKYESGKPHTEIGVMYAEECEECDEVINSIASHHGDVEMNNIYSIITSIADRISAGRPGSRKFAVQNYIERIAKLEEIGNSVIGVSKCYALQGGREIRLIVEAAAVSDEDLPILTDTIKRKIENNIVFPGVIQINAIRETRYSQEAIKNNNI